MPRRNRDELDELLREVRREAHFQRVQEASRKAREPQPPIQPQRELRQLEAQGWYENRTILIVRENHDHSLTPLGVYIEHIHPAYGRHLVPCPSLDDSPNREIVQTWGDPRPRIEPMIETEEEITSIRNRFQSLLDELEEENDE